MFRVVVFRSLMAEILFGGGEVATLQPTSETPAVDQRRQRRDDDEHAPDRPQPGIERVNRQESEEYG
jgi:hypothetical protein